MFTRKYDIVGDRTQDCRGTLLDLGARDRVLRSYLHPDLNYQSADQCPGHDFQWNLEQPLDCADNAFDVVVALDVLEHLECIHQAFDEMLRIARSRVYVSLPNMACLSFRMHFLRHGRLAAKYALLPDHQGDRHRWLTSYLQMTTFVNHLSTRAGWSVRQFDVAGDRAVYGRWFHLVRWLPLSPAAKTHTTVFEISRTTVAEQGCAAA
jgi:hypothetical protein